MVLFDKGTKENSEYINDAEKWVVALYALWSDYTGGRWYKIGGYDKNEYNGETKTHRCKIERVEK